MIHSDEREHTNLMELTLLRKADTPMYRQIVQQVRQQIRDGTLRSGARLPPVRQVAAECHVTRLTVHSAYSELQAEGLVESHVGRGTFVAPGALTELASPGVPVPTEWISRQVLANLLQWGERNDVISFAQAFPDPRAYPTEALGSALKDALAEEGSLNYGHIQGEPALRKEVARILSARGMAVSAGDLLITAGAQQGIDVALRALTVPGDVILVAEPVYPGALERAALGSQRVIGIPYRGADLDIAALEAACSGHKPRLLYLVPTCSNPTGLSVSRACREAILRIAQAHDILILEDDSYGFLGFDRPSPPALHSADHSDRVVYLTSFSKMLAPALRLGVLVAHSTLLPALTEAKQSSDLVCSTLMQRALARYLTAGQLESHVRKVRTLYKERRDAMVQALERHLPQCSWTLPEGGLSLWVDLPNGIIEREFLMDALHEGVGIAPGAAFFAQPQARASMRLSFGTLHAEQIEAGVATLGALLKTHLSRASAVQTLRAGAAGPLV